MRGFLNPLEKVAKELGLRINNSQAMRYLSFYNAVRSMVRLQQGSCRISREAAELLAKAVLVGERLSTASFICVSDYVGGPRFVAQARRYELTLGEAEMLSRASALKDLARETQMEFLWTLILADGWGLDLYPERVEPGALDAYCAFMAEECAKRGLQCVRWSEFMAEAGDDYAKAFAVARLSAEKLAVWEASRGEIAHDRVANREHAHEIAMRHIQMRAAEGLIIVAKHGPTVVLSTETRKLTRYDNLLVGRSVYTHVFCMPFYPHRL